MESENLNETEKLPIGEQQEAAKKEEDLVKKLSFLPRMSYQNQ